MKSLTCEFDTGYLERSLCETFVAIRRHGRRTMLKVISCPHEDQVCRDKVFVNDLGPVHPLLDSLIGGLLSR